METAEQQIIDRINKANRVLIALPQNVSGDAVGAGLAFLGFLKKLEKEPDLVTGARDLAAYAFLPDASAIKHEIEAFQSFVISVNTTAAPLDELSYEPKGERVDIFLKPKSGKYAAGDISFRNARFPYDLIVTLSATSLDNLGEIYEKNTDLFFETPIINIDYHPNNEYYGEINHVDLTATSTSEILSYLIENFEAGLVDERIATNLLTGIIVETNSFQHAKTTPRAFLKASQLIAAGGNHKEIIKQLYKTKSISLLKLWGRSLARLKELPELGLTYSLVSYSDIEKTGSNASDVFGVMKELVANLSGSKIILFLAEVAPQDVVGYFHLHPSMKSQIVAPAFSGQMLNGNMGMFSYKGTALLDAEKDVLEKLAKIKDQISG